MIAAARPSPTLSVELVPLDDLRPDPANPRRIDPDELDALERSLREFGFVQPVLARRDDQTVIGGHQRLVAARRLGLAEVPVTWLDLGVEEARLLGLALNRIGGSFDDVLLARLLADLQSSPELDLTLAGFDDDEVRDLLRSLDTRDKRERVESFDLDEALASAKQATRSKPGDLWVLGDHRLLCGDATDPAAVARLLDGANPTLLATDPPYGVSLDASWRDELNRTLDPDEPARRGAGHRNTTIAGDTRVDWSEAYALVPSLEVGYVWHADRFAPEVAEGLRRIGFELVCQLIWDKERFPLGRSWYHWSHEPCWVVRKTGTSPKFLGSRDQATIWRVPSPKMPTANASEPRLDHPTQKPLVLFETPIRNHLRPGGGVYDPFAGSGTVLVAAERTGAAAFAMEIDPVFVDVALARWERFSGESAVLVDG